MHPGAHKLNAARLIALAVGLQCTAAHANVVMFPFIWFFATYGILIVAVSIVAEAIVYRLWFPIGWFWRSDLPGAVPLSVFANFVSAVAGWYIAPAIPSYLQSDWFLLGCTFVGFSLVSSIIEFPVVWLRVKLVPGCSLRRIMFAVLVANAVSYCLIGGLVFGKEEMARRDEAARDARRQTGDKACRVVNVEYGAMYGLGIAIRNCMSELGTTQGCDAGTHGIFLAKQAKQIERELKMKFVRSLSIKDAVIAVEMDVLGEDGRPLSLTLRPPPLAADLMAPWEKSGSVVEACDRYEIDRATHRSETEREKFHQEACWFKFHGTDIDDSWPNQVLACIEAQGSPIGCNAGTHGIDRADVHQIHDRMPVSIIDGVLKMEFRLRDDDGKRLTFEARPQKGGEGNWVFVRSGTVLDVCKSDVEK